MQISMKLSLFHQAKYCWERYASSYSFFSYGQNVGQSGAFIFGRTTGQRQGKSLNSNATDSIWRVLASSDGISSWTPLKPQHSNPHPKPLANQLWCIDILTHPTRLIIPHRLPAFLESLKLRKNWCSIHERCSKSSLKDSIRFYDIFSKFKTEYYCISFF